MKKRGQITIFIIAGIVLLLTVGVLLYYTSFATEREISVIPVLEEVSAEAQPIRDYVQDCVYLLTEEAVEKLGMHGGYIDVDKWGLIMNERDPTNGQGIIFAPDSNIKVPYWWYMAGRNDCRTGCPFSSEAPGLKRGEGLYKGSSIEEQLDEYLIENLPGCLDNFAPFLDEGKIITATGEIEPQTIITDQDIAIYLEYPIDIEEQGRVTRIKQYYAALPVNLKTIYELADEIMNIERNSSFIERKVIDLIYSFQGVDANRLPPSGEVTFEKGERVMWRADEVKEDIQDILMIYSPAFQIINTRNYERQLFDSDIMQAMYDGMTAPLYNFEGKYDHLAVNFDYLAWWPIYFQTGEGQLIKPESFSIPILPLGFNRYYTTYDVSFPMTIQIRDEEALNGKGYSFFMALEGNIRNDEAMNVTYGGHEGVSVESGDMVCNPNQRNSGNITVEVKDGRTNEGLADVLIGFGINGELCELGRTNSEGFYIGPFPSGVINGVITYEKEDYLGTAGYLTTVEGEEAVVEIETMWPIIEKEIRIEKLNLVANALGQSQALARNEQVMLQLTKVKDNPLEQDHQVFAIYQPNGTTATLLLTPGKYEGRIDAFRKAPPTPVVYIPPEKRESGWGPFKKDYTIPEVRIEDDYLSGGAEYDQVLGYLTIHPRIYQDNRVILKIIAPKFPPTRVEDLDEIGRIGEYSQRFNNVIQPRYE